MFFNPFPGLPGIAQLDTYRHQLFNISHHINRRDKHPSTAKKVGCWLGHKVCTIPSLSANLLEAAACTVGFGVAACTLGTLKVAIFAATLGNVQPSFSTGCLWFGNRALHGLCGMILNTGELVYDVGDGLYQGYRLARWVAGKLYLDELFEVIFRQLGRFFEFVGRRFEKGLNKALEVETRAQGNPLPFPLSHLNDLTNRYRIDFNSGKRPLDHIFKHYVLSVANIPLTAATAVIGTGLSIVSSAAFVAKVILYTVTNINIPLPTLANRAINLTGVALAHFAIDMGLDIADVFILIYKTAEALQLTQVVVTVLKVVYYIPRAIFS